MTACFCLVKNVSLLSYFIASKVKTIDLTGSVRFVCNSILDTDHKCSNALDGDIATSWVTDGEIGVGHWIEVTMPGERMHSLHYLRVAPVYSTPVDGIFKQRCHAS